MPGGDGTGPLGMGPMTGRAAGYCAGYPVPGFMNPTVGGGVWGWGRGGGGWGRRNWFYATGLPGWQRAELGYPAFGSYVPGFAPAMTAEAEMQVLKNRAAYLEQALQDVRERIEELETEKE